MLFDKIVSRFQTVAERSNYIFLISHMRGYTTLLSHILGSHEEILGYTEMHQSYRTHLGLTKLRYKAKFTATTTHVPKYLFDKLLHSEYKIYKQISRKKNVHLIIMVREPIATIKSILKMGQTFGKVPWYKDEPKVLDYYIKRLAKIVKNAKEAKGNYFFIEGERLIDNPDIVLSNLSSFLGLETPLSKEYQTFNFTGTPGLGDSSEHIKAKTIVKKRDKYKDIHLSEQTINTAKTHYQNTIRILKEIQQK